MKPLQKILHVDDEADIREVTRLALEAIGGFEVQSCDSCEQALEVASNFSPDLLLLDVMMPGRDGPATLEALRELPQMHTTRAVFMTAKVQTEEVERYLALGADGVVTKPFDPMTLADQLKQIWENIDD